ncbi:DUF4292 domain-containing protein [Myroides odoratimimus]|uniref:DUF4292 domain-containing protein n=1 Tax=Myroides odoratimimus TaxID=76832 RepID=UPI0025789A50|nr:DUF4292 domain-containing protein [Myroides odoratimimus]MDM1494406.1 DUF4292 domain-containing protein [Myroides odoratimimus]MDM1511601.1 DUF4292 domain-containing protein [Myroides odoratimimus]
MRKISLLIICTLFLVVGCKKKNMDGILDESEASNAKTVLTILNNHNKQIVDFTTTAIRSSASYEADNESKKFSMDIFIEKDKQILLNIRFISIPIAKVYVTPEGVQYYEKWNKVFFKGDFSMLSQWLGTDLNYTKFQNLLLGQALDAQSGTNKYEASIEEGLHKIKAKVEEDIQSAYFFEDQNGLLKKEEISQASSNRIVTISYPEYKKVGKYTTPTEINIDARQEKSIHLNIRYDNVTFNDNLNFNYKVPAGYKQVGIKQ